MKELQLNKRDLYGLDWMPLKPVYMSYKLADLAMPETFETSLDKFTRYCLTQWIQKLPGGFEIHWDLFLIHFKPKLAHC